MLYPIGNFYIKKKTQKTQKTQVFSKVKLRRLRLLHLFFKARFPSGFAAF
ncbi:hypothetical protein BGP_2283 [Beggiatoa sp. PS]|nr:hypothetical protein BGP_2283 [Beggiatoa sp. PS]